MAIKHRNLSIVHKSKMYLFSPQKRGKERKKEMEEKGKEMARGFLISSKKGNEIFISKCGQQRTHIEK
jgi:hypothetical protein